MQVWRKRELELSLIPVALVLYIAMDFFDDRINRLIVASIIASTTILITILWPEEYEEEGIHFPSPGEKKLIEEARKIREPLMKFREAAIKSGEAVPIKIKKRRYLRDKTEWP